MFLAEMFMHKSHGLGVLTSEPPWVHPVMDYVINGLCNVINGLCNKWIHVIKLINVCNKWHPLVLFAYCEWKSSMPTFPVPVWWLISNPEKFIKVNKGHTLALMIVHQV